MIEFIGVSRVFRFKRGGQWNTVPWLKRGDRFTVKSVTPGYDGTPGWRRFYGDEPYHTTIDGTSVIEGRMPEGTYPEDHAPFFVRPISCKEAPEWLLVNGPVLFAAGDADAQAPSQDSGGDQG